MCHFHLVFLTFDVGWRGALRHCVKMSAFLRALMHDAEPFLPLFICARAPVTDSSQDVQCRPPSPPLVVMLTPEASATGCGVGETKTYWC